MLMLEVLISEHRITESAEIWEKRPRRQMQTARSAIRRFHLGADIFAGVVMVEVELKGMCLKRREGR
jgi:hypothetical protein